MATAEEVLDRFGIENVEAMSAAIWRAVRRHPEHASCDCPAIEALKVLLDNEPQL